MATETIRDVVIRLRLEQEETKLKVPGAKEAVKEVNNFNTSIKNTNTSIKNVNADIKNTKTVINVFNTEIKNTTASFEKLGREAEDTSVKIKENMLKAGEGFKAAGEGAFTLARGIAFISASTEEDFQKSLQTIVRVQGAFDLFKGSIETVKGLSDGIKALRAASAAAAIQQAALAAGNTAVATTGTAAATSMTALNVALGPVGLAVIGIGVGVAALAAAWAFFSNKGPADAKKTEKALKGIETQAESTARAIASIGLQETLDINRAAEDRLLKFASPSEKLTALRSRRDSLRSDVRDAKEKGAEEYAASIKRGAATISGRNVLRADVTEHKALVSTQERIIDIRQQQDDKKRQEIESRLEFVTSAREKSDQAQEELSIIRSPDNRKAAEQAGAELGQAIETAGGTRDEVQAELVKFAQENKRNMDQQIETFSKFSEGLRQATQRLQTLEQLATRLE